MQKKDRMNKRKTERKKIELHYTVKLGYNKLPVIMNKLFRPKSNYKTIKYPSYNELPVITTNFAAPSCSF